MGSRDILRSVVEVVWNANRPLKAKDICAALAKMGHRVDVTELNRLLHDPAKRPAGLVYASFMWSYDPEAVRNERPTIDEASGKKAAAELRHPDGPSTKRVVAAVTPTEHEAWTKAAAYLNVSLSDLVRQSVAYYLDARRSAQSSQVPPPRMQRVDELSAHAPPERSEQLTQIGLNVPAEVMAIRRRQRGE